MSKILLVEDDEALQHMYTTILKKEGHDLVVASDGVEGLAEARKGGFDLILLDLMMPNLDGLGFLKGLKDENPDQENGSIVVLSNAGYNEIAKEAMDLGAKEFLMKADLLPEDLVSVVQEYVKNA